MKQCLVITLTIVFFLAACGSPPSVSIPTTTAIPSTNTPLPTVAPSATPQPKQDIAPKIKAILNQLAQQERFTGSVLIAQNGEVLLSEGYGLADRAKKIPNTPQTKFRIGSLTKQFTAMAILILQAQGKLNVEDRICTYIADCPARWQPITIHQLLTHTSGIPSLTSLYEYRTIKKLSLSPIELIAQFSNKLLDFKPGKKWSYSNSGYIVLGAIIERVSGQTYEAFIQEHILTPLKMTNTGYEHDKSILATGYTNLNSIADDLNMSIPYASGSLYSTAEDLYRWDQALYTEQLISKELRDMMFLAAVPIPEADGYGYGYAWFIDKQFNKIRYCLSSSNIKQLYPCASGDLIRPAHNQH